MSRLKPRPFKALSEQERGVCRPACGEKTVSYGPGFVSTALLGSGAGGLGIGTGGAATGTGTACREYEARSSHLPKIIFPAVVCKTDVTETSIVLPIIFRALSTTTIVPSSR